MVPKCPVCSLSGLRRKCDAALVASRKYVTVQVLKKLKCAVVCYLQGMIFNPTNLLNHVVSSIEPTMQKDLKSRKLKEKLPMLRVTKDQFLRSDRPRSRSQGHIMFRQEMCHD